MLKNYFKIAFITLSEYKIRAAKAKPIEALRYK